MNNRLAIASLISLSFLSLSCGSTKKPVAAQVKDQDFVLKQTQIVDGVLSVVDGEEQGTALSSKAFVSKPDEESNISFKLKLSQLGHDKGVTLYAYTDKNMQSGYALSFFLDSHHPGEVELTLEVMANGEELGHFHIKEDVEPGLESEISIDFHPAEPHIIVMLGKDKEQVFNSEERLPNLSKARLGDLLALQIGSSASISLPSVGPAVVEE